MTIPSVLVVGSGRMALDAAREIVAQGGRAILARSGGTRRQCALRVPGGIEVIDAMLVSLEGSPGRFRANLRSDEDMTVECSSVILAPGPDDRPTPQGTVDLKDLAGLAVSEDAKSVAIVVRPGAPRSSFIHAIRAARELRSRSRAVAVFADEMSAFGIDELEYRSAQAEGVMFFRTQEAVVSAGPSKIMATDLVAGSVVNIAPDMLAVVTPAPLRNREVRISHLFSEVRGSPSMGASSTATEGVLFAGHEDELLEEEAVTAARAAATKAMTVARSPPDRRGQAAIVDRERCSACLTCLRVCPFGAARPGEEGKAIIDGARCQACGICVGACPGRAISLPSLVSAANGREAISMGRCS